MTEAPERIGLKLTDGYAHNWYGVLTDYTDEDSVEYIRADLVSHEVQKAYASAMNAEYKIREDAFNAYRLALDNVTSRAQTYENIADNLARLLDKVTDKNWIDKASASEVEEVDLWLSELRKVKEYDRHQE